MRRETPIFPTGDCHVGACQRPADHGGRHGERTASEARTAARRTPPPPAPEEPDWGALYAEYHQTGA